LKYMADASDAFKGRAEKRRTSMTAKVAHSKAEAAAFERARDREFSSSERAEAIWPLVCEMFLAQGGDPDELRFDRSVARLERRRR